MDQVYNTQANARILQLVPPGVSNALDIGCGTGRLGAQLSEIGIVTDGVTFNEAEREMARKSLRDVWLFDLEQGLPQLGRTYDLVVLSHIMEHVANPSKLMSALDSVLTASGYVLCAIPNMLFLHNRLKLLMGKVEYEEFGLMDYTHVRWYTRKTIRRLFESYGYRIESEVVHGYAPLGPLRKVVTENLASLLDTRVVNWLPDLMACEFAFRLARSA